MFKTFLLLLCLAFISTVSAQKSKVRARLTETTVVKDTSGNEIPYVLWKNLVASSDISFYPEDPTAENSVFIIRRLNKEEKQKLMEKMPMPDESKSFKTGAKFITFNEIDINGNRYKLKELKGKVVVINFWFINCPPCRMEIPELNDLVASYKENKDVIFIGIALDEKYALQEFLKTFPFDYNIIENGRNLATSYRVKSFPTHVVVDRDGKVKFHTAGLAKNTVYWIKKSIDEALTKPVEDTDVAASK
ncbi:MAG TPA: TlpA disulfide reductase family protein [Chitinophagaceae bacterium]|nr:TlpA disulfide reductase family protein [Chitinophagaceae bacterium]